MEEWIYVWLPFGAWIATLYVVIKLNQFLEPRVTWWKEKVAGNLFGIVFLGGMIAIFTWLSLDGGSIDSEFLYRGR